MKVKEVMTTSPAACTLTNTLADAAGVMWQNDCGVLPVLAEGGKVVGILTDRDICMSGMLNARQLAHIAVAEIASNTVLTCRPDDDLQDALKTMKDNRIRRLPVISENGLLKGILSMNDIVLRADDKKASPVTYADVVNTYKSICGHPLPQNKAATAG